MQVTVPRRRPGRPQVFADSPVVATGIALHPRQNERLRAYAARRGTTLAGVLREIVGEWERATFPE